MLMLKPLVSKFAPPAATLAVVSPLIQFALEASGRRTVPLKLTVLVPFVPPPMAMPVVLIPSMPPLRFSVPTECPPPRWNWR